MSLLPVLPAVSTPPSGEQWVITHADQEAVLTEVGAALRTYTAGGRPLVAGFAEDQPCPDGRGQVLAPWPNRLDGGRYTHDGVERTLPLTEPQRGNAIHGLVAWLPWQLADRTAGCVSLVARLHPQPGWDWTLDLEATYTLDDDGLSVHTRVRNVGSGTAPFGYGAHPYLCAGPGRVDDWSVAVPASSYCAVDPHRLLPLGSGARSLRPVEGTGYDLRAAPRLGERAIDVAYTGLPQRWAVRVEGQWGVELWGEARTFPWVHVYTGDSLPRARRRTSGIAVEPTTCPPNALRTGEDLVHLGAGQEWAGTWGIRAC